MVTLWLNGAAHPTADTLYLAHSGNAATTATRTEVMLRPLEVLPLAPGPCCSPPGSPAPKDIRSAPRRLDPRARLREAHGRSLPARGLRFGRRDNYHLGSKTN